MKKLFNNFLFFFPRIILFGVFILYIILALLSYFDYFEPYIYPLKLIRGKATQVSRSLIVGPYPNYEEMKKLREKYDIRIIISLLNINLPQERALWEREKRYADMLGLKVYNFPMEYLPVDSESNINEVRKLIKFVELNKKETIYVHCYLGRHRINLVVKNLKHLGF